MADSEAIFKYISIEKDKNKFKGAGTRAGGVQNQEQELKTDGVIFSALTPNMRGLETALSTGSGVGEVAVFGAGKSKS